MSDDAPTILVVDDQTPELLAGLLVADGYCVGTATSGPDALRLLDRHAVELVILDVGMPGMDGYEVLAHIRRQHGEQVAVLLASAQFTEGVDVAHGLRVGADDYILKPFDYTELRARVVAKLRQRRLEQELRQARHAAEVQNNLLLRVLSIIQEATRHLEPGALSQTIHQGLHETLGVGRAAVWRVDEEGRLTSTPDHARSLPPESIAQLRAGGGLLRDGLRLLAPLRLNEALIGVLDVERPPEWPLGSSTVLQTLADALAILFQTSHYVQQIARENAFHTLLNQLSATDLALEEMVGALCGFLHTHLLLVNRWYHLLVPAPLPALVEGDTLRPAALALYQARGVFEEIARQRQPLVMEPHGDIPAHRVFPVVLGSEVSALLLAVPEVGTPDPPLSLVRELERAARFLAGVLQRRREVVRREQQRRAGFITGLLSGQLVAELDRSDLFLYAGNLGLNLAQPGFVARLALAGFEALVDLAEPTFEQRVEELLEPLLREVQVARRRLRLGGVEARVGKDVTAFLSLPSGATEEQARRVARSWAEQVVAAYRAWGAPGVRPAIGLGRLVGAWQEWPRSADEAERALRWALRHAQVPVSYYGDLGSERLLAAIPDRQELARFHAEQLGPLLRYDAEREGQLLRTLETFYSSGGGIARASAALAIHPNTLKYRLDQIAQLTGRDPREPHVALDLQLALKIQGML